MKYLNGVTIINTYDKIFYKGVYMKTMTCSQLGGACDMKFHANTFEEMAELAKAHGMEMFQTGDEMHLQAMSKIQILMQSPEDMQAWFESKRQEFEALPQD